ncbi:hypothetical protein NFJ02_10g01690 [Pycnococcus provasolii]
MPSSSLTCITNDHHEKMFRHVNGRCVSTIAHSRLRLGGIAASMLVAVVESRSNVADVQSCTSICTCGQTTINDNGK